MIYWTSFSLLASSKSEGFGLNPNILEANLINILLLLVLLVYTVGTFLKDTLFLRQEQILQSIEDCEKRLNEANERLAEAKSQWLQAQLLFEKIKSQTKESKKTLVNLEFQQANDDLSQRFNNMILSLQYREDQVFNEITKQVAQLALHQVR